MDAVVPGADGDAAAADVDIAFGIVAAVFGVQAVRSGSQVQVSARDADGIVGLNGLGGSGHGIGAAGDFQVVLAHDAVIGGLDGQGSRSVQGQVGFGEDHAVGLGAAVAGKGTGDGKGAVSADGDEYLVGGLHIDHGEIGVGNGHAVQHNLHLIVPARFHIHGHVGGGAGEYVHARGDDVNVLAVRNGVGNRAGQIGGLLVIPAGEQIAGRVNGRCGFRKSGKSENHAKGNRQRENLNQMLHNRLPAFLF